MNFLLENRDQDYYREAFLPLLFVNLAFASYFLLNEARQLGISGLEYFTSFWNYIDIIPPIGIYVFATLIILDDFDILHVGPDF